jgi:hypothetical protein
MGYILNLTKKNSRFGLIGSSVCANHGIATFSQRAQQHQPFVIENILLNFE